MWKSLLVAIDQGQQGPAVVDFTTGLALGSHAEVRVFHVRECSRSLRIPPLETLADAQLLVDEAVFCLWSAGVVAEGRYSVAREDTVAARIVEEAARWRCDAIVLGSHRLRGFERITGGGVRERVIRASSLPVVVSPTVLGNSPTGPRKRGSRSLRIQTPMA